MNAHRHGPGDMAHAHRHAPGEALHTPGHDHAHHHGDERQLLWALLLTGGFMVAEAVAGVLSGSLALLAMRGTC